MGFGLFQSLRTTSDTILRGTCAQQMYTKLDHRSNCTHAYDMYINCIYTLERFHELEFFDPGQRA